MPTKCEVFSISFLLLMCICKTNGQNGKNFIVEKVELCEDLPNQVMKLSVKPKTFTAPQIMDIDFYTPVPLDDLIKIWVDVESEIKLGTIQRWQRLVLFEDDLCRVLKVYMGEYFYDIESAMGIPRGACPIARVI